ncbi:MAG TPA: DNA mismatch repair endonuclease MutL [Spirochaetota bacterium]|nr:DNA mismatch repair endonuclease MutL [Spirochaetota bacterium]
MNRIQILPESVKKKIAAGEVVEGPFSVVKELVENSIDAASTEIEVEIYDSGLKKIVVRDNGSGIHRDDVALALMEHATSKIREIGDIERIATFGFRGEALSSIAEISRITMYTRTSGGEEGARLAYREGSLEMRDYAGPVGTTIIVENLFYNTPARKKFLKSKTTEMRNIRAIFLRMALAHPEIRFALLSEGKPGIRLERTSSIAERAAQVYGSETMKRLQPARLSDISVSIEGFLSTPEFLKSTRSMQMLYVNRRAVEYRYLGFLLSRAYEGIAAQGRLPAAILFIDVDPGLIDVNIHPAKREIKFFDQKYFDNLITALCRKALGERPHAIGEGALRTESAPGGETEYGRDEVLPFGADEFREGGTSQTAADACRLGADRPAEGADNETARSIVNEGAALYRDLRGQTAVRALGVVFDTYILCEDAESLCIVDFHAAHERFIYDELMKKESSFESQALVFPKVIELSLEEFGVIGEHASFLAEIGFDMDEFSENAVIVRSVPVLAAGIDIDGFFADLVESLTGDEGKTMGVRERVARRLACHSARRAGDGLLAQEIDLIIQKTFSGAYELRCPHGRPFVYRLGRSDMEKLFKRS